MPLKKSDSSEKSNRRTEKRSMTLRLSAEAYAALQEIATANDISITEAVKRSVGTEHFLMQAKRRGDRLQLADDKDQVKEIILR